MSFPSISGCPSGVTCTVSPSSITASGTATLNVPTLITTTGTYSVVVTAQGSGDSPSHQVTFTVTVTAPPSFNFNVLSTNTQVIVTVTWTGTGTASVTIAGPGGTPEYSESGAVVYNRISYVSGVSPPMNLHRVIFTLSSSAAGVWTASQFRVPP